MATKASKPTVVGMARKDPGYLTVEFLVRILQAAAYRIRRSPTVLSSKVQNQAAMDVLDDVVAAGKQIGPPEKKDPRVISYLREEMLAMIPGRYDLPNDNFVPATRRFTAREAQEATGNDDAEAGWYATLTVPGYIDTTDWTGPARSEEAVLRMLQEEQPYEPPPIVRAVTGWLGDIWVSLYRQRPAGFIAPNRENARMLVRRFYEFGRYLRFDRKFIRELLQDILYTPSQYILMTESYAGR